MPESVARCRYGPTCVCDDSCQGGVLAVARQAGMEAQAQALNVLLVYAEESDPRAIRAFGALCAAAAFNTPNQAAALVLRAASRRLMHAAGEEVRR